MDQSIVINEESGDSFRNGGNASSMLRSDSNDTWQMQQQQQQQLQQEQSFSDWWNEYWSRQPFPSGYTQSSITLLACFISTIIFLIVVGNMLVCIAIFTEKSLKPTQNWFIASLAVSDMLLGLVVMPFSLARELMGFWIFGPLWCDIHEATDVLLTTASINTLCLISLDRYWSITQAVSYLKKRTPRRGAFMIAFVWVFSAAVSLPPLFGWKKQSAPATNQTLDPVKTDDTTRQLSMNTSVAAVKTTAPSDAETQIDDEFEAELIVTTDRALPNSQRRRKRHRKRTQNSATATNGDRQEDNAADSESKRRRRRRVEVDFELLVDDDNTLVPLEHDKYATSDKLLAISLASTSSDIIYQQQQQPNYVQLIQQQQPPSPGAIINAPAATTTNTVEYPTCQLSDDVGYVLYSALGSFYIPCAVMVFTYIKIFLAARSRARRAINKQSRAQIAAEKAKRLAATRRTISGTVENGQFGNKSGKKTPRKLLTGHGRVVDPNRREAGVVVEQQQQDLPEPTMMRGKLIVVERRKSTVTPTLSSGVALNLDKTVSIAASGGGGARTLSIDTSKPLLSRCKDLEPSNKLVSNFTDGTTTTITTSEAKRASLSVLNDDDDKKCDDDDLSCERRLPSSKLLDQKVDSTTTSDIQLMDGSFAELPVTRFNFTSSIYKDKSNDDDSKPPVDNNCQLNVEKSMSKSKCNDSDDDEARRKTDALLRAISQARQQTVDGEILDDDDDIALKATDQVDDDDSRLIINKTIDDEVKAPIELTPIDNSTNETCFMTIEEDSDNFDSQTGRTIMMVAGTAKQSNNLASSKSQGIVMKMLPPAAHSIPLQSSPESDQLAIFPSRASEIGGGGQVIVCNNLACIRRNKRWQQRHHRSRLQQDGSSLCGGGASTSCDEDADGGDGDEDDGDDEEEEDCDDVEDDDDDDDEALSDACNGFSGSCGGLDPYCAQNDSICGHCLECSQVLSGVDNDEAAAATNDDTTGQISGWHHKHRIGSKTAPDDTELQSLTVDDNLSLTDYRSNEENSSLVGHDMLDATIDKSPRSTGSKKRQSIHVHEPSALVNKSHHDESSAAIEKLNVVAEKQDQSLASGGARKKSSIGSRLARFGSNVPNLSGQSGGLLALAASQQLQADNRLQLQMLADNPGNTTRNLKALRQNFFNKLNQLTAKSATKRYNKSHSSTGKSSAQSSGSSYDPSIDYATTSNVHSTIEHYHQETTFAETDDYEQQTSGDTTSRSKDPTTSSDKHDALSKGQQKGSLRTGCQTIYDKSVGGNGQRRHVVDEQDVSLQSNEQGAGGVQDKHQLDFNHHYQSNLDQPATRQTFDHQNISNVKDGKQQQSEINNSFPVTSDKANSQNVHKLDLVESAMELQSQKAVERSKQIARTTLNRNMTKSIESSGHSKSNLIGSEAAAAGSIGRQSGMQSSRTYLASDNERHKRKLAKARERRATLILGLIMTTFICSWLPFFTFYVLRAFCHTCRDFVSPRIEATIFWMGYCNSAINPIIYTIFNRDFRKAFRKILFKCL